MTDTRAATPRQDPRLQSGQEGLRDIRPSVQRPRSGLSGAGIAALAAVGAMGLFGVLEARRHNATAPATRAVTGEVSGTGAPPPLYVPAEPRPVFVEPVRAVGAPATPVAAVPAPAPAMSPVPTQAPPSNMEFSSPIFGAGQGSTATSAAPSPPRNVSGPALVVDTSTGRAPEQDKEAAETENKGDSKRVRLSTTRARAAMLANRSTTVPQGTLIPAVLETGFDSTAPGFARALVQKDVHGFDGTRVLIPRGSRLIGEYGADTERGQRRAVILWSRLIRPDGVTIAIGSPAADPVGRGGVKADVNTHFLERFSGAILQSALDLGITLAARSSRSPVIVALPGAGSRVASTVPAQSNDISPTLRVPPGRSVSVFVARDLDFTEADGGR